MVKIQHNYVRLSASNARMLSQINLQLLTIFNPNLLRITPNVYKMPCFVRLIPFSTDLRLAPPTVPVPHLLLFILPCKVIIIF